LHLTSCLSNYTLKGGTSQYTASVTNEEWCKKNFSAMNQVSENADKSMTKPEESHITLSQIDTLHFQGK